MKQIPLKTSLQLAGVVLVLLLISLARCQGERAGRAEGKLAIAKAESRSHQKRADSLLKEANQLDAVVKAQAGKLAKAEGASKGARIVYRALRDTLSIQDTVAVKNVLRAAEKALDAADEVIAVQGEIIALQGRRIALLGQTITAQDSAIKRLNQSLTLTQKGLKPSRLSKLAGATKWIGTGVVLGAVLTR